MANTQIGTASLVIEPDFGKFEKQVAASLARVKAAVNSTLGGEDITDSFGKGLGATGARVGQTFGQRFIGGIRNQVQRGIGSINQMMGGISSLTAGVGSMARGAAGIAAAAGVATFGLSKVATITDQLNQSLALSETVFGSYADSIQALGQTTRGLSQGDFLALANNLGSQFTGTGWSQSAAASLTTAVLDRLPDIAAAANVTGQQVADTLQSALVGEYDPLQRMPGLGGITAASIAEKGVSMFGGSESDLTMQQKQLALIEQIIEKTNQFQGIADQEFATSFTAQLEELKASFKDLLTGDFGQGILENAIQVIQYLNDNGLPLLERLTGLFNFSPEGLDQIMDSLLGMGIAIVDGMPAMLQLMSAFTSIAQEIAPYAAMGIQFIADNLHFLTDNLAWVLGGFAAFKLVPGIFSIIAGAIGLMTNPVFLVGAALAAIGVLIASVMGKLESLMGFIGRIVGTIKTFAGDLLKDAGVDFSAFDAPKTQFDTSVNQHKLSAGDAKLKENEQMAAFEKMRLGVDLEGQKAQLKRDKKQRATEGLEMLSQYNI